VVYGVSVEGENVWVATASGAGRLNLHTGQWSLYNERNTPMREIWVYGVSATAHQGLLRRLGQRPARVRQKTGRWDKYDDPDGETEMVLFKDQGLIHEIVSSVSYVDNIVWASTYFRRQPLRRPLLAQLSDERQRTALELHQLREGRGRQSRLVLHRQGAGLLRRRKLGRLHASLSSHKPEMTVRDAKGTSRRFP
jgi:hypothetical protein